jgi:hypothetical protein
MATFESPYTPPNSEQSLPCLTYNAWADQTHNAARMVIVIVIDIGIDIDIDARDQRFRPHKLNS